MEVTWERARGTCLFLQEKSECPRRKVGAIIITERGIYGGYNGSGCKHGDYCLRSYIQHGKDPNICGGTHAEVMAIGEVLHYGESPWGSKMMVTTFPCMNCAKHIVHFGISKLIYLTSYGEGDKEVFEYLDNNGVTVLNYIGGL